MGPVALAADIAYASSMSRTRSIACRRAVRTAGDANSGCAGRRFSRTVVSVAPG